MSTGISTSTTRLTLQENVFLNININVDTLQEYVCTYFSYRPLPLTALVFEILICTPPAFMLLYEKVLAPL